MRRQFLRFRAGNWAAVPGIAALVAGALVLSAYSGASSSQGRGPDQPIAFPHPVHVQKLGMNCLYCHYTANKSPDPGMPAVSTCIGCHALVGPDRPASDLGPKRKSAEIEKLQKFADLKGLAMGPNARPIPWERIHKLPEYVKFPHFRHVNAGVTCQTCHGEIQNMRKVAQAASLNMGWCVNCHVNGYDPEAGRKLAANYDASTVGAPGAAAATQQGAAQAPATSAPAPVHAQFAADTTGAQPGATDKRLRARYDCAICHY